MIKRLFNKICKGRINKCEASVSGLETFRGKDKRLKAKPGHQE